MKNKELELKFLIPMEHILTICQKATLVQNITQGYVSIDTNIRVRIVDDGILEKSFLTIKGDRDGISRDEYEYEIPYEEGIDMLYNLGYDMISKTRFVLMEKKDKWEIDVFHGKNSGLIIAEVEVPKEDYDLEKPKWFKDSKFVPVHDDDRFYNHNLSKHPYMEWKKEYRKEQIKNRKYKK